MFEFLRPILPEGGQHKGTSPCKARACDRSTREGKPFCSEHIESAPYVAKILQILEDRAEEERILLSQDGGIPKKGFFYTETLLLLRSKNFTAKGLSRRLDINHDAAKRLIVLMGRDGLVKVAHTSRGDLTISGLAPKDLSGGVE